MATCHGAAMLVGKEYLAPFGFALLALASSGCSESESPSPAGSGASSPNQSGGVPGQTGGSSGGISPGTALGGSGDQPATMPSGGSALTGSGGTTGVTGGTATSSGSGGSQTGGNPASGGSAAGGATTGGSTTGGSTTGGNSSDGGAAGGGDKTGGSATAGSGGTPPASGGNAGSGADVVPSPGCGSTTYPPACTPSSSPCTLTIQSIEREYYIELPSDYDSTVPHPVVFAWPYYGGTASGLVDGGAFGGPFYGVKLPGAIYVAAQGLPQTDGGTDYVWANRNGQDIEFAGAIVDWLEDKYCIDQSRLFSVGMSWGGVMADYTACSMSDVFRAIAAEAGGIYGASCDAGPVAAWMTHGTADDTVPLDKGIEARDALIANNGCQTTSQPVTPSPCVAYDGCKSGYPVIWCQVEDGPHNIPSFAADAISEFFGQF